MGPQNLSAKRLGWAIPLAPIVAMIVERRCICQSPGALAGLVGAAALGLLLWRKGRLRGTTMMAPCYWAAGSFLAVAGVEIAIALAGGASPPWAMPLRYVAAMTTFCPTMAVLGAKRPQDRAWQWVVLSLWAILSLPSAEWWLFGSASQPGEIHAARSWFLAILIVTGTLNHLPTRFWPSSLLVGAAQVALVSAWPPWSPVHFSEAAAPLAGLILAALALLLACVGFPRARPTARPIDRVWLDFRDSFGALWALRVAERINSAARLNGWQVSLSWRGLVANSQDGAAEIRPEVLAAVEDSLRTLLRRFVSPEWIAERLGGPAN